MDEFNIYDDLEALHAEKTQKTIEDLKWKEKYEVALCTIQQLQTEKKELNKKMKQLEMNFASLLDTARTEIKRKDTQICQLRKEKDDICFRRKNNLNRRHIDENADVPKEDKSERVYLNPFARESRTNITANTEVLHHIVDDKLRKSSGERIGDSKRKASLLEEGARITDKKDHHRNRSRDCSRDRNRQRHRNRSKERSDDRSRNRFDKSNDKHRPCLEDRRNNRSKERFNHRDERSRTKRRRHDRDKSRTRSSDSSRDKVQSHSHRMTGANERGSAKSSNGYGPPKLEEHSVDRSKTSENPKKESKIENQLENVPKPKIEILQIEILKDVKELKKTQAAVKQLIKPIPADPVKVATEKSNQLIDALFDDSIMNAAEEADEDVYGDLAVASEETDSKPIENVNTDENCNLKLQTPPKNNNVNKLMYDLFGPSPGGSVCAAVGRKNSVTSVGESSSDFDLVPILKPVAVNKGEQVQPYVESTPSIVAQVVIDDSSNDDDKTKSKEKSKDECFVVIQTEKPLSGSSNLPEKSKNERRPFKAFKFAELDSSEDEFTKRKDSLVFENTSQSDVESSSVDKITIIPAERIQTFESKLTERNDKTKKINYAKDVSKEVSLAADHVDTNKTDKPSPKMLTLEKSKTTEENYTKHKSQKHSKRASDKNVHSNYHNHHSKTLSHSDLHYSRKHSKSHRKVLRDETVERNSSSLTEKPDLKSSNTNYSNVTTSPMLVWSDDSRPNDFLSNKKTTDDLNSYQDQVIFLHCVDISDDEEIIGSDLDSEANNKQIIGADEPNKVEYEKKVEIKDKALNVKENDTPLEELFSNPNDENEVGEESKESKISNENVEIETGDYNSKASRSNMISNHENTPEVDIETEFFADQFISNDKVDMTVRTSDTAPDNTNFIVNENLPDVVSVSDDKVKTTIPTNEENKLNEKYSNSNTCLSGVSQEPQQAFDSPYIENNKLNQSADKNNEKFCTDNESNSLNNGHSKKSNNDSIKYLNRHGTDEVTKADITKLSNTEELELDGIPQPKLKPEVEVFECKTHQDIALNMSFEEIPKHAAGQIESNVASRPLDSLPSLQHHLHDEESNLLSGKEYSLLPLPNGDNKDFEGKVENLGSKGIDKKQLLSADDNLFCKKDGSSEGEDKLESEGKVERMDSLHSVQPLRSSSNAENNKNKKVLMNLHSADEGDHVKREMILSLNGSGSGHTNVSPQKELYIEPVKRNTEVQMSISPKEKLGETMSKEIGSEKVSNFGKSTDIQKTTNGQIIKSPKPDRRGIEEIPIQITDQIETCSANEQVAISSKNQCVSNSTTELSTTCSLPLIDSPSIDGSESSHSHSESSTSGRRKKIKTPRKRTKDSKTESEQPATCNTTTCNIDNSAVVLSKHVFLSSEVPSKPVLRNKHSIEMPTNEVHSLTKAKLSNECHNSSTDIKPHIEVNTNEENCCEDFLEMNASLSKISSVDVRCEKTPKKDNDQVVTEVKDCSNQQQIELVTSTTPAFEDACQHIQNQEDYNPILKQLPLHTNSNLQKEENELNSKNEKNDEELSLTNSRNVDNLFDDNIIEKTYHTKLEIKQYHQDLLTKEDIDKAMKIAPSQSHESQLSSRLRKEIEKMETQAETFNITLKRHRNKKKTTKNFKDAVEAATTSQYFDRNRVLPSDESLNDEQNNTKDIIVVATNEIDTREKTLTTSETSDRSSQSSAPPLVCNEPDSSSSVSKNTELNHEQQATTIVHQQAENFMDSEPTFLRSSNIQAQSCSDESVIEKPNRRRKTNVLFSDTSTGSSKCDHISPSLEEKKSQNKRKYKRKTKQNLDSSNSNDDVEDHPVIMSNDQDQTCKKPKLLDNLRSSNFIEPIKKRKYKRKDSETPEVCLTKTRSSEKLSPINQIESAGDDELDDDDDDDGFDELHSSYETVRSVEEILDNLYHLNETTEARLKECLKKCPKESSQSSVKPLEKTVQSSQLCYKNESAKNKIDNRLIGSLSQEEKEQRAIHIKRNKTPREQRKRKLSTSFEAKSEEVVLTKRSKSLQHENANFTTSICDTSSTSDKDQRESLEQNDSSRSHEKAISVALTPTHHKIFSNDNFPEDPLPVYNANDDDVQYQELDNCLRSMFQSPSYAQPTGVECSIDQRNESLVEASNDNLNVNEALNQSERLQCDTSMSSRKVSLGSKEYVIESVGTHTANVFITRKKCKKRTKVVGPNV